MGTHPPLLGEQQQDMASETTPVYSPPPCAPNKNNGHHWELLFNLFEADAVSLHHTFPLTRDERKVMDTTFSQCRISALAAPTTPLLGWMCRRLHKHQVPGFKTTSYFPKSPFIRFPLYAAISAGLLLNAQVTLLLGVQRLLRLDPSRNPMTHQLLLDLQQVGPRNINELITSPGMRYALGSMDDIIQASEQEPWVRGNLQPYPSIDADELRQHFTQQQQRWESYHRFHQRLRDAGVEVGPFHVQYLKSLKSEGRMNFDEIPISPEHPAPNTHSSGSSHSSSSSGVGVGERGYDLGLATLTSDDGDLQYSTPSSQGDLSMNGGGDDGWKDTARRL